MFYLTHSKDIQDTLFSFVIFLTINYFPQLLAMIGEQFDCGDEICGAVVNVRSGQDKISIWTKNASNEAAQVNSHQTNCLMVGIVHCRDSICSSVNVSASCFLFSC